MKIEKWDHQKISRPGIYSGVPLEFYHGDCCVGDSVSSSGLRTIYTESPAHYFEDSYLNTEPDEDEDEEKKKESVALVLGRAAHHLLLGEEAFLTTFVVRPKQLGGSDWQGNRKECRAWLAQQAVDGRTVLLPSHIRHVRGMAKALTKHPLIKAGILNGQVECSLFWKDKETGIWLKARPDVIPNDSGDAADLKTTRQYGYDFDHDASKMRYDMQAALTKWAFKEVLGLEMQSFSLIPVTTSAPYCCDVLTLNSADISMAEADLRVALKTFAHCRKTGDWFGPAGTQSDARFLAFSQWVRDRAEHRRDFLLREIERAKGDDQPTQLDYLGTP